MSKTLRNILYSPIYLLLHLLALLPLPVLYVISDLIYFIVYRVVGYRRKVVRENLAGTFTQKSEAERRKIEKDFYRHFADYMVETIKLLHISDKEMRRRMEFVNAEILEKYAAEGRSVMLMLGHYGNWEWVPSVTLWCNEIADLQLGQLYRPLRNKWFDNFFLQLRSRFGTHSIPKAEAFRTLVTYRRNNRSAIVGVIADQTPSRRNIHYRTHFLRPQTAVLTGFEKIARKLDMVLVYVDVEVVKRGYYRAELQLLEDNPAGCPDNDITERYIRAMERTILRAPHAWLWTHKRWKHAPKK